VANAVLGSPSLTEAEIESFSAMKNVSDQVLRHIGHFREWTKSYGVVANHVKNLRTPLAISLNLVARLNLQELRREGENRRKPGCRLSACRKGPASFLDSPDGDGRTTGGASG
jgi:hypothetical protein